MKKHLDGSDLDFGGAGAHGFGQLLFDGESDSFNYLPAPDVPAHVDFQVHAATATSSATTTSTAVGSASLVTDVDFHWDGITFAQSGGYYPPDNALAAGANIAITAENDAIQFTTLQGTNAQTESLNTFFGSVLKSGYFVTDPRVLYDTAHHEFLVAVDEVSNNLNSSYVLLAASKSDLATTSLSAANWQFESVSTTYALNGLTTWSDQPLVAVDGHNIYLSTNQFSPSSSGTFQGTEVTILDDGLFGGTASNVVSSASYAAPSYQTAINSGAGPYFGEYLVADTHNALSVMESNNGADSAPVSVSLGSFDFGNGSYSASQYSTKNRLDAGDGRITSAAYDSSSQKLYVVFEGQPSATNTTPSAEWAQLDMTNFNGSHGAIAPTLLLEGNLNSLLPTTGTTAGAATFNGSVATDANGDVLFNFNVSGPHMYAADYFAVWHGAGAGTNPSFSPVVDYHDSAAAYIDPNHDAVGRWGDYSTAAWDPAHPNGFYISNEFDNGKYLFYSSWGTAVAHVLV